jgi:hypothetical protein
MLLERETIMDLAKLFALIGRALSLPIVWAQIAPQYQLSDDKLTVILNEILKDCEAIDKEIRKLVLLRFTEDVNTNLLQLHELNAAAIQGRIYRARGNSGKIDAILKKFLSPSFRELMVIDEQLSEIKDLVAQMRGSDGEMDEIAETLAHGIESHVDELRTLVSAGQYEEANRYVVNAAADLEPKRKELWEKMGQMQGLKADFSERTKTT